VVPTTFNMSLFDTVDLMQRTDVFLGMHGACFLYSSTMSTVDIHLSIMKVSSSLWSAAVRCACVFRFRLAALSNLLFQLCRRRHDEHLLHA